MCALFRAFSLAVVLGPMCATAGPVFKGIFRAAQLGLLDLSVSGDRVVGKFRTGGSCSFSVDDEVLSGTFQGSVFVGNVAVCQSGEGCTGSSRLYPLLAFWSGKELAGEVPLPDGCQSAGLIDGHRFTLEEATAAERALALQPSKSYADKIPPRATRKEKEAIILNALKAGTEHFNKGRYLLAASEYELAIVAGDSSWTPLMMLGVCKVKVRKWRDGKLQIEKGLKMGGKAVPIELRALAAYALAVVAEASGQRAEAWTLLKGAVAQSNQPQAMVSEIKNDPDLKDLRHDAAFPKFLDDLDKQIARAAKKPRGG